MPSIPQNKHRALHASLAVLLTFCGGMMASVSAQAATNGLTELSPTPPNITQAVAPNIVVTFDNSGSMLNNYMGDNRPFDGGSWSGKWRCAGVIDPRITAATDIRSRAMNGVYYNPLVLYSPPMKADGTSFANADINLQAVPLDGIGINRPYGPVTADATASYRNNPNGTTDPTGLTDLTGTVKLTYPQTTKHYVTFGDASTCPSDADNCQPHTSGTVNIGTIFSPKYSWAYWIRNPESHTGTGNGTVYYGSNLQTRGSSNNNYTAIVGDRTNITTSTNTYVTWDVTVTDTSSAPTLSNDNRWKCGYGTSPMDGYSTDPDGSTYPNGGPFYYRYKSSAPTIAVDSYGNPNAAGKANLYDNNNWEAVAVPNTDVTIKGTTVNQWQNFANWYAYYRTRNLMTRSAMSRVFGSLGAATDSGGFGSSIRVAWQVLKNDDYLLPAKAIISSALDAAGCDASTVNPLTTQQKTGTVKTPPACYRSALFNWIFQVNGNNDTPNRAATIRVGKFFQRGYDATTDTGNTGGTGDLHDPYWEPPKVADADGLELVCRQNFHMLVTDGYWNETNNYTVSDLLKATDSTTLPDGTAYSNSSAESQVFWDVNGTSQYTPSLADIGFTYWASNLRPDLYKAGGDNTKIVPPYMPNSTTGIVTGATSTDLEKYFNPANDPANWPHLVQYMVTLGIAGKLTYSDDTDCTDASNDLCKLRRGQNNSTGTTGWPKPYNNDPTAIDDTWKAAITSRGNYFSAANPQNLVDQLTSILTNINARNVPATTGALSSGVLITGALGFSTGYQSSDWSGIFTASQVDVDGSVSPSSQWDGAANLTDPAITDPATRQILTSTENTDGSFDAGIAFATYGSLDTNGQTLLMSNPTTVDAGASDTGQARIDYLRGDRTLETSGIYRTRGSVLGAIINAQAVFVSYPSSGYRNDWPTTSPEAVAMTNDDTTCDFANPTATTCHSYEAFAYLNRNRTPTVYVAANDGMLHAFDASQNTDGSNTATSGHEQFAYVPRAAYANLGNLTRKTSFKFMPTVDATPVTHDVFYGGQWHTILVGGLRLGGRGVYALDITDPSTVTQSTASSKVLWEFTSNTPATTDGNPANLGYTYGEPNIGRLANGKWVVLVPGGYFPDCSKPDKPANCATIAAATNGYSSLFVLNAETGALIKELKTPTTVDGDTIVSFGLAKPVLGDYNNDQIDDVAFAGDLNGNLWRFDLTDASPANWQAHVTLAYKPTTPGDQPITTMPRLFPDPATNRFIVVFGTGKYLGADDNTSDSAETQSIYGIRDKQQTDGTPIPAVVHANLQQQVLADGLSEDGVHTVRALTNNALTAAQNGWYIDLDLDSSPGERVVVTPAALFNTNRAFVTTLIPGTQDPCSATIGGAAMVFNAATGGSDDGLSGPFPPDGGWADGYKTVGALVKNPPTGGSLPVATSVGGGKLMIPGLEMQGGGTFSADDAIWRRRSWRELNNDQ